MLAELETRSFRNLADPVFVPGEGRHLVVGANGAGKTSLLEAIYCVATTRSFRTASLGDCVRHGEESFHLRAEVGADPGVRLELGWSPKERLRLVNGSETSASDSLHHLPVVAWRADDLELFDGPPTLGRRFLDRGIVASRPGALGDLRRYRRALEQKRELVAGSGGGLESWNRVLAEAADAVIAARRRFVEELEDSIRRVESRVEGPVPPVEVAYRCSPRSGFEGSEAILDSLRSLAAKERERGIPLAGPHRDRLLFLWRGRRLGSVASAGERKSVGLLVAAAQADLLARRSIEPVVLLDDADTELDQERLAALWPLFAPCRQVLATSNRPGVWRGLPAAGRWIVEGGSPRPAD